MKRLMITKNLVVKIQNLFGNQESWPFKLNPVLTYRHDGTLDVCCNVDVLWKNKLNISGEYTFEVSLVKQNAMLPMRSVSR